MSILISVTDLIYSVNVTKAANWVKNTRHGHDHFSYESPRSLLFISFSHSLGLLTLQHLQHKSEKRNSLKKTLNLKAIQHIGETKTYNNFPKRERTKNIRITQLTYLFLRIE